MPGRTLGPLVLGPLLPQELFSLKGPSFISQTLSSFTDVFSPPHWSSFSQILSPLTGPSLHSPAEGSSNLEAQRSQILPTQPTVTLERVRR